MLQRLFDLGDRFLAQAANMSAEAVRARFQRCRSAFQCVLSTSETTDDEELVGYFILLPVNEKCCEALRSGTIRTGRDIQVFDLAVPGDRIGGIYLSVVFGSGPRAQSVAIEGVLAKLREVYSTQNVRHLFARAATAAGARMLERLTSTTFQPDGRIHTIDMARYEHIDVADKRQRRSKSEESSGGSISHRQCDGPDSAG
jgi:hypothetical protein